MSKIFITFAAGDQKYLDAANRLISQAKSTNIFDQTILYTAKDLQSDAEFWSKHGNFIENNPRGYGYWLWKPYLIKKTMSKFKYGDVLLYLDCGCEIDKRNSVLIKKYFEIVKWDKVIGTETNWYEYMWNKMDLVIDMNVNNPIFLNSKQRQAGAIMFFVMERTRNMVDIWYKIGSNYHLIDDSPSISRNVKGFKEHRHDQSIFSALTKIFNLFSKHSLFNIIEYNRNISEISLLK
jgi:hypothetical protein